MTESEYSIRVVDAFGYHASVVYGLSVESPGVSPLVVGCSLRTREGAIVDLPARWLTSPGLALWTIRATPDFVDDPAEPFASGWSGDVIFAIYTDDSFVERLSDTGWLRWQAPWLIGSSTRSLDYQDDLIREKYGERLDAWMSRKSSSMKPNDRGPKVDVDLEPSNVWMAEQVLSVLRGHPLMLSVFERNDVDATMSVLNGLFARNPNLRQQLVSTLTDILGEPFTAQFSVAPAGRKRELTMTIEGKGRVSLSRGALIALLRCFEKPPSLADQIDRGRVLTFIA